MMPLSTPIRFLRLSATLAGVLLAMGQTPPVLAQTPELVITTGYNDRVLSFDGVTGTFVKSLRDGSHAYASGTSSAVTGPEGRLYIAISYAAMIARLNPDTLKFEIYTEGGDLNIPHQIAFGPDGDLYVANYGDKRVDRFDAATGYYKSTVYSGFGGEVTGIAVDKAGNVYISERQGNVYKYDGTTISVFTTGSRPEALLIGPDNLLYVIMRQANSIYRYQLNGTPFGANGNTSDPFLASGGGLMDPVGIAIGPNGDVYVSDFVSNGVFRFDRITGAAFGLFTQPGPDVQGAWGITFVVAPGALRSPELPATIVGGTTGHGRVRLSDPAPAGGAVVWLTSNSSAASVPAYVTVPAGLKHVRFNITTTAVGSNTPVTITSSYLGQTKSATFTVTP